MTNKRPHIEEEWWRPCQVELSNDASKRKCFLERMAKRLNLSTFDNIYKLKQWSVFYCPVHILSFSQHLRTGLQYQEKKRGSLINILYFGHKLPNIPNPRNE
jgi:hypothetical protein